MTHEQIQGVYAIYTTKKCEKNAAGKQLPRFP